MEIKAIDTEYKGYLFRSRLEARYGVYFDELNCNWEYETEGFELGDGVRYLPDFYLSDFQIYAEIKPKPFDFREHQKCKRLAVLTGKTVIELVGLPEPKPSMVIIPYNYYECPKCSRKENLIGVPSSPKCNCRVKMTKLRGVMENEAVLLLQSDKKSYQPLYYTLYHDCYTQDPILLEAAKKAKQARFEFKNKR